MTLHDIEQSFNRALYHSFSRKKLLLTFPTLIFCGILVVFCKALALGASNWVSMSLVFLPIFLSSGMLLALGVILSRLYYRESKQISVNLRRLFSSSLDLIIGISYLSLPPLLLYIFLWMGLGLFFLMREIPGVGEFFGIIFSFAPFLLIFGSLILCLFNLSLLFFVAPAATLQSLRRGSLAKRVFQALKLRFFSAIVLFMIAMIPLLFIIALLSIAALLTNMSFSITEQSLALAMQWFFIMIPFAAILTPATVFFFNFAFESYALLQRDEKCVSQF